MCVTSFLISCVAGKPIHVINPEQCGEMGELRKIIIIIFIIIIIVIIIIIIIVVVVVIIIIIIIIIIYSVPHFAAVQLFSKHLGLTDQHFLFISLLESS
jgi:Flp pilus assembly protein TadB